MRRPARSRHDAHVHEWFELTYANYLVLPRSLLQEMPLEWQERFVRCLRQMRERFDDSQVHGGDYVVQVRGVDGRFIYDPLSAYRHPDQQAIERARRVQEVH